MWSSIYNSFLDLRVGEVGCVGWVVSKGEERREGGGGGGGAVLLRPLESDENFAVTLQRHVTLIISINTRPCCVALERAFRWQMAIDIQRFWASAGNWVLGIVWLVARVGSSQTLHVEWSTVSCTTSSLHGVPTVP